MWASEPPVHAVRRLIQLFSSDPSPGLPSTREVPRVRVSILLIIARLHCQVAVLLMGPVSRKRANSLSLPCAASAFGATVE
jgi:hypothetical protein